MSGEFSGIDFATGVVTGVRSFKIDKLGRLTGINYPQVWKPGENLAECRKKDSATFTFAMGGGYSLSYDALYRSILGTTWPSAVPTTRRGRKATPPPAPVAPDTSRLPEPDTLESCQHGFYAYYDGSNDYHDQGEVTGVIEGYGEVLIGTRGFRCMKARIVALRIHKKSADRLGSVVARNYASIPQFKSFDDMVAAFPPDGGTKSINPATDPDFWERAL